ncbi:MAG: LysM peptidoglycan-binding domain-containing protein [Paucibacter sp.]|nr:LysM peptidoglycan-binding domain-containing protein [Roseateles sp.]
MSTDTHASKALLVELAENLLDDLPGGKTVTVQFNPESLKLSFANQIQNNSSSNTAGSAAGGGGGGGGGSSDQAGGTQGRQFIGAGTTKLSVQLWFDAGQAGVDDVRKLSQEVIYFIKGKKAQSDPSKFLPPGLRFSWGSFNFKGLIDSIEETIDYFSPEGKALRSTLSMGLSQQTILISDFGGSPGALPGLPATARAPGTVPMTPAAAGSTLQGLAAAAGAGVSWQALASANGIDNPRQLAAGQLLNLSASVTTPRS